MLRSMPMDLGDVNLSVPAADWRVALFLVAAAAAATAFFALMPALQATRVDPVRTMRGELVKDARPGTRTQRADWRAGVRVGAAADHRRDLPAQCDRLVWIRSGFAYRRHGVARYGQRAQACRDAPGDRRRAYHYRARGRPATHAGDAAASVRRHRRRQDATVLQVRHRRVFRRVRRPDRARPRVHGSGGRRLSRGHRFGIDRARPLAEWRWHRRDVPVRAGSHGQARVRRGPPGRSRRAADR